MPKRPLRVALLLVLLGGLVPLKMNLEYGLGEWANDADYYFTIARSVAEGEGLKSNLSLYYQGFKELPHHVTGSPVWPLFLGGIGAVIGMEAAALWVPNALFLLSLVLLYLLGVRLTRAISEGSGAPEGGAASEAGGWLFREDAAINLGHVAVLLFGLNAVYFQFSSVPNNEPLAFSLVFSALLAVDRAARGVSVGWALLAGTLAGLALLTRFQALGVAIAVPLTLGLVAFGAPRARKLVPAALLASLVPFVPWLLYLMSWNSSIGLGEAFGLETQRETPELDVFSHAYFPASLTAFVWDRLQGVLVAFDWRSEESYIAHFGWVAYLVPLILVLVAWRLLRAGPRAWVDVPAGRALAVATVLTGLGMLAPVHAAHMTFVYSWLFGFRHGLPLILLIVPALAYLDSQVCWGRERKRVGSALAGVVVLATLVWNVQAMQVLFARDLRFSLTEGDRQMVKWLEHQSPRPTIVTTQPWMFGAFSRAGYHWTLCRHKPEHTLKLMRLVNADYLLVRKNERDCPFVHGLRPEYLETVLVFGKGTYILKLREEHGGAPSPRPRRR